MNEDQLLDKAVAGDVDAFAELFETYRKLVFSVAYRLVGPNDAEDIVMDTYVKAWRAIPRFTRKAKLKTWLYRITYNCAMDLLRKRQRTNKRFVQESDDLPIANYQDAAQERPGNALIKMELSSELTEALGMLDDVHKTIVNGIIIENNECEYKMKQKSNYG